MISQRTKRMSKITWILNEFNTNDNPTENIHNSSKGADAFFIAESWPAMNIYDVRQDSMDQRASATVQDVGYLICHLKNERTLIGSLELQSKI